MKKILAIFVIFIMSVTSVSAKKADDNYSINLNGQKYTLLYSKKDKEHNGYLNEYFKQRETYNNWSEMVGIHHFPNAYSPIDQVRLFREYLGSLNCPSALSYDEKKNTAIIDFVMISEHRIPVVLEFNIFKFQKSNECGSVALQYARRYTAVTAFEVEAVKEQFEKDRKVMLKKVKTLKVPAVVSKDIDKCEFKLADEPSEENKLEKSVNIAPKEEKLQETPSEEVVNVQDKTEEVVEETSATEEKTDSVTEEVNTKSSEAIEEVKAQNNQDEISEKNEDLTKLEEISKEEKDENKDIIEKVEPQNEIKVNHKKKNKKEQTYQVINNKDEYIAKPRTKKEIKERNKKLKEERLKKSKKQAKKRVKNASEKINGK